MQPPSPTGALGAPSFYALGWRRMGKETDSLRMRYLDKVRKMRQMRNKKLGGVRKPSTLKPKVAPETPMDTTQDEALTSKYTISEQRLLDRFRITPESFAPEAEAEWAALWPQSLGPGLEEAERAMRSFHLPNGDVELYIQEYDPDASDEMVQVQLYANLCYLLCKSEPERLKDTWAEMEAAYAEYLQKVASAPDGSAMDVQTTTPTAAKKTAPGILPAGPVWSGRKAAVDGLTKTCVNAVKGVLVGSASTYISAQGVAMLISAQWLGPGVIAALVGAGGAIAIGAGATIALGALTKALVQAAASLPGLSDPPTVAGTVVETVPNLAWRTAELDLVNYDIVYNDLAEKQSSALFRWLLGIDPASKAALGAEQALANQEALLGQAWEQTEGAVTTAIRYGDKTWLKDNVDVEMVVKMFRKYHIVAQDSTIRDSSLLRSGQKAVMNKMDLVTKRNREAWFKETRMEYVKDASTLDAAEDTIGFWKRRYGTLAATHLVTGFAQQRWAKQKLTVDYVKSMLGEDEEEKLQAEIVEMEEKLKLAAEEQEKAMLQHAQAVANGDPAGTISYRLLQLDRSKLARDRIDGKLKRLRARGTSQIGKAVTIIENKLCAVSSAHIQAYILSGEQSNPRKGILRAHLLPGMARPGGTAPLGPEFHVAAAYTDDQRGANSLVRFQAYTTLSAEDERRTILYYFEDVLGKETQTQLEKLAPRVDPDPGSANKERDFSAIGGWLGMNPKGDARGDLKTFYQMIDHFNAEKTRLIDKRLLALGPNEDPQDVYADRDDLTNISDQRPCNGTAAAPNGAVSVVDAAFARLAV